MPTNINHSAVCFGEVLWDVLPFGALPGGAPMNVAYHLRKLGQDPVLITKVGMDDWGKKLINHLADNGLNGKYLGIDYKQPTGLVYATPNYNNDVVYDIVFPSAWDFITWEQNFSELVRQSKFFVFGTLACRSKTSRETLYELLDIAAINVLDINLRPPHYNRKDVEYLLDKTDILKLNIDELELITGWFTRFESTEDRLRIVQDKFNLETVIVTMGNEGAILNHDGKIYRHGGIKVVVADTIGCGDAFLAGFLSQLLKNKNPDEALAFASTLGAFIATKAGACPFYETENITEFSRTTFENTIL